MFMNWKHLLRNIVGTIGEVCIVIVLAFIVFASIVAFL
jgi:hypothetical protein